MIKNAAITRQKAEILSLAAVDRSALAREWRDLADRADVSFWLSWSWIGHWLDCCVDPSTAVLVRVTEGERLVALSIWVLHQAQRRRVIRSRQFWLHATGDADRDVITIEHNGLLCASDDLAGAWAAVGAAFAARADWDELVLPGMAAAKLPHWPLRQWRMTEAGSARVDLRPLRGADPQAAYLASLGKSTREKLRRALRLWQARGPLHLDIAQTPAEAAAFMAEATPHHRARWGKAAMDHEYYAAFHRRLWTDNFDQLLFLRARCGDRPFAWFYNFQHRGEWLFYFGAADLTGDPKLQPGLVGHLLAIVAATQAGAESYDFLAGDTRYKLNLGQKGPSLCTPVFFRPRPLLRLEDLARRLKARLRS